MLRVLSGQFAGRTIETPGGRRTRPPLARVRKAVFDVLRPHIEGASVLDLFGGSGSYAFEALSGGAQDAAVIELSDAAANVIAKNAGKLGVSERVRLIKSDAFREITRLARGGCAFDIVFVAPPQGRGMVERAMKALNENPLLKKEAIAVCQFETGEIENPEFPGFTQWRRKKYGNTEVAFYLFV